MRDLLGTQLKRSAEFPADDLGEQFDTVGSALTLSPLYVLAYERAAERLADDVVARADTNVIVCSVATGGEGCMRSILTKLLPRAFRRPVVAAELEPLLEPFRQAQKLGATLEDGLRASLAAVLLSPAFLFKLELDAAPDNGAVRALQPYELATRLSYALWATMPDEELFAAAASGALSSDEQLTAIVDRMLLDERSQGLLDTFVANWLGYRELAAHEVEATLFPDYDAELASAMAEEARLFFGEFLQSERPVREMLDPHFTYVNGRLAEHYGLTLPPGALPGEFTRVDTTGTTRSGLLTLGAVLTTTSFAARTSPVRRGQFVLARLLCSEIPPPPPGVEGLPVDTTGLTLRERLQVHRESPACNACHSAMDPLGFGLENYDAIGRYREFDGDVPVDATGELPNGTLFDGAIELGSALREGDELTACMTHKFITFAVGRIFDSRDAWVPYLEQELHLGGDPSFRTLVRTALLSRLFRDRQAGKGD